MHLTGTDKQSFRLEIVGYQFPLAKSPDDSNWLQIAIDVTHPRGSWSNVDPSLLTHEVARLAGWLDAVAAGEGDEEEGFLEPNLSFRVVNEAKRLLRVYFELDSRPHWGSSRTVGDDDLFVTFRISEVDLTAAARSLREQLSRYPQRA